MTPWHFPSLSHFRTSDYTLIQIRLDWFINTRVEIWTGSLTKVTPFTTFRNTRLREKDENEKNSKVFRQGYQQLIFCKRSMQVVWFWSRSRLNARVPTRRDKSTWAPPGGNDQRPRASYGGKVARRRKLHPAPWCASASPPRSRVRWTRFASAHRLWNDQKVRIKRGRRKRKQKRGLDSTSHGQRSITFPTHQEIVRHEKALGCSPPSIAAVHKVSVAIRHPLTSINNKK